MKTDFISLEYVQIDEHSIGVHFCKKCLSKLAN